MEISDEAYEKIQILSEEGDLLAQKGLFSEGIEKYREALTFVPDPKTDWEAACWLYTAIGDAQFYTRKYEEGRHSFHDAYNCADGRENPFINLRLGQCYFELGNLPQAEEYMMRAFMTAGAEIFEEDDPKYFDHMKSKFNLE